MVTNENRWTNRTLRKAIEDGCLYDASAIAREAGVVVPVAITAAVRARVIWDPGDPYYVEAESRYLDLFERVVGVIRATASCPADVVSFTVRPTTRAGCPPTTSG
jgi:hypothetical protein